jgi:hypothetical protein
LPCFSSFLTSVRKMITGKVTEPALRIMRRLVDDERLLRCLRGVRK